MNSNKQRRIRNRHMLPDKLIVLFAVIAALVILSGGLFAVSKIVFTDDINVEAGYFPQSVSDFADLLIQSPVDTEAAAEEHIGEDAAIVRLGDEIYSKYALMIKLDENYIICEKNANERAYPASLTKIMTAIVAIENLTDVNTMLSVSEDLYDYLEEENASVAGFEAGEEVRAIDMLFGILLPSGADAALGIAEYLFGSEEKFVEKMNEKAEELGLSDTHFVNVTGLHNDEQYSTAADIAVILEYALNNDLFYEIFCSDEHIVPPTPYHPYGLKLEGTFNRSVIAGKYDRKYIVGGKTGFTDEAFQCLASLAEKDGVKYILVTMGAGDGDRTLAYHVIDAIDIYLKYME